MKPNILLVDDDQKLTREIAKHLESKFEITIDADFTSSLRRTETRVPDLVLLDYKLEREDGVRWLNTLRQRGHRTPVIVMSGYADQKMAIDFMKLSVAGFLEKPFLISELEEAIEKAAVYIPAQSPAAGLVLDQGRNCVVAAGERIELTPIEFKILEMLVAQAGKTIERKNLIQEALGREAVSRNALDTHISNLKRKVPELERRIKVVYGRGFFFD